MTRTQIYLTPAEAQGVARGIWKDREISIDDLRTDRALPGSSMTDKRLE
ncbi:MAG: hypothetical protein ACK5NG_04335 [Chthoniobacterales bacterium]